MLPAFLITLREVIEASLIVATILGILEKLKEFKSLKTVWLATAAACILSLMIVAGGSLAGFKIHELYEEKEALFEGVMMVVSAVFITWAVFFLHKYFAQYKLRLLQKMKSTLATRVQTGLFLLVFTAVFREGLEIAFFLSTIYLSSRPVAVFSGVVFGSVTAIFISLALFRAAFKLPVYRTFQLTTLLLILFAAGLLGRGIHEFQELGMLPGLQQVTFAFLPPSQYFASELIQVVFGWSQKMTSLQLVVYATYIEIMRRYVYGKKRVVVEKR